MKTDIDIREGDKMEHTAESVKIKRISKRTKKLIFCLALIILPLIQFAIFYIGVNLNSIRMAFVQFDGYEDTVGTFVWFENFKTVFHEMATLANWPIMIRNSVGIWVLGLVTKTPLTILISYFIYKNAKIGGVFKVILFAPSIVSVMVTVMLYEYFVDTAIPSLLESSFGIVMEEGFFKSPNLRFWTIFFYGFWCGFGTSLLLYSNAMDAISDSVVEASHLDGVGYMQEFWYVTMPMIFPTFKTLMMVGSAGVLLDQFYLYEFYGMKAYTDIQTVGYYVFKETMLVNSTGYPRIAAMGIIITCVAVPFALLIRYLMNKVDPREG